MKRITLVVGHYGSGKTEVSVNLVLALKKEYDKVAILDMDIANPYFRSRERQAFLEERGITAHFNTFGYDITADLPAIPAVIKTPLENKEWHAVADVGGDSSGALVLNQFHRYFEDESDCEMLMVVNANRPLTDTPEGAIGHIESISRVTGLRVAGLVNNTHLLRETTADDIVKGWLMCREIEKRTGIPLRFSTCVESLAEDLEKKRPDDAPVFPISLYMRPSWLDRRV